MKTDISSPEGVGRLRKPKRFRKYLSTNTKMQGNKRGEMKRK
jgi:hypothetical protein